MIKNKYDEIQKIEKSRIHKTSFIKGYGTMPVHNEKFNKLMQYLEKTNKKLQVANPTEKQKNLQNIIIEQRNIARLEVLRQNLELWRKQNPKGGLLTGDAKLITILSFRQWCGAGTDIYENIKNDNDDENRMYTIDRICRDHDIRYTKGRNQKELHEADDIMVREIFDKYILNFKRNFISKEYETDFSTWQSATKTTMNYLISLAENAITLKGLIAPAKATFHGLVTAPINLAREAITYLNPFTKFAEKPKRGSPFKLENFNAMRSQKEFYSKFTRQQFLRYSAQNVKQAIPHIPRFLGYFYFSSLIVDKIFAITSLILISAKKAIEETTGLSLVAPTQHEFTDQELQDIIKTFEELQNEYLEESGLEKIKIGNEWENEKIIYPTEKELENEITDIYVMNKTYLDKQYTISETMPEPPKPSEAEIKTSEIVTDLLANQPERLLAVSEGRSQEFKEEEEEPQYNIFEDFEEQEETPINTEEDEYNNLYNVFEEEAPELISTENEVTPLQNKL